jgi:hypothetical protein
MGINYSISHFFTHNTQTGSISNQNFLTIVTHLIRYFISCFDSQMFSFPIVIPFGLLVSPKE